MHIQMRMYKHLPPPPTYIQCTRSPPTQLVHGYGFDASLLPSRGLLSRFSRPKKGYLEEMQHKLEGMLMTVVQKFEGPPMELLKFVEYPFTVSGVGISNS